MGSGNARKRQVRLQSAAHYYPLQSGTRPIIQTALIPSDFRTRICHLDLFSYEKFNTCCFRMDKMSFWVLNKWVVSYEFRAMISENWSWGVVFISFSNDFPDWNEIYLQFLLDFRNMYIYHTEGQALVVSHTSDNSWWKLTTGTADRGGNLFNVWGCFLPTGNETFS